MLEARVIGVQSKYSFWRIGEWKKARALDILIRDARKRNEWEINGV